MAIIERHLEAHTTPTPPAPKLPRAAALPLGIAWLVLFPLALALEPASVAPETIPLWEMAAGLVLLTGLGLTAAGLAFRKPWAAAASLATSLVFVTGVFACPATGHHAFGLWWFGELAAAVTLVTISAVSFVRTRRV
jgi:hypothetical protein